MAVHEPLLNVEFAEGEEEGDPRELFDFEDCEGVVLGCGPDTFSGEDFVGEDCGHTVEEVVEDPVEHFD